MPLVTLCGLPVVGKTTFALQLASYLREKNPSITVVIINEGTQICNCSLYSYFTHSRRFRVTVDRKGGWICRLCQGEGHSIGSEKFSGTLSHRGQYRYSGLYELHQGRILFLSDQINVRVIGSISPMFNGTCRAFATRFSVLLDHNEHRAALCWSKLTIASQSCGIQIGSQTHAPHPL